jgi:ribonuclease HI
MTGDRKFSMAEFDHLNIDAPPGGWTDDYGSQYEGWGKTVLKSIRPEVSPPRHVTPATLDERELEIWTDGSLQKAHSTYAVVSTDPAYPSLTACTVGEQEINNAEMQAVLTALRNAQNRPKVTLYSDSLNTVRFCTEKYDTVSRRQILRSTNPEVKLQLQRILRERDQQNWRTTVQHVRSHAQDKRLLDHAKRQTDNIARFGSRQRDIEAGNDYANRLAGSTLWVDTPIDLRMADKRFLLRLNSNLLHGSTRRTLAQHTYDRKEADWRKRQPVWSGFDRQQATLLSLPQRNDAN